MNGKFENARSAFSFASPSLFFPRMRDEDSFYLPIRSTFLSFAGNIDGFKKHRSESVNPHRNIDITGLDGSVTLRTTTTSPIQGLLKKSRIGLLFARIKSNL